MAPFEVATLQLLDFVTLMKAYVTIQEREKEKIAEKGGEEHVRKRQVGIKRGSRPKIINIKHNDYH